MFVLTIRQNNLNFFWLVTIKSQGQTYDSMTEYSEFAANRYRQYKRQKQKESLIHRLVILILRILHALMRTLEHGSIKRPRRVEKVNVEQEEEK
jgi:hypothetical protein